MGGWHDCYIIHGFNEWQPQVKVWHISTCIVQLQSLSVAATEVVEKCREGCCFINYQVWGQLDNLCHDLSVESLRDHGAPCWVLMPVYLAPVGSHSHGARVAEHHDMQPF